jgi:hypothetical protein
MSLLTTAFRPATLDEPHILPEIRTESHGGPESRGVNADNRLWTFLAARATGALWTALALSLIAAACGVVVWLGLPRAATYGHDTFIALDGGWRVLNGQRPNSDFYSPLGPIPFLIAAAGLKLASLRVEGLAYATAAVGALLGMWTWALVRTRLKVWSALLALAFLVSFWLAPFPLGEPYYMTGYAMQYNRLGYVLASLILLELYLPGAESSRKQHPIDWGGVSTGFAAGLLCFLKINYAFVGCALVASAYLLKQKRRKHSLFVLGGFALAALPMLSYLHWDVAAMVRDLRIVAAARQVRFMEGYDPFRTVFHNLGSVLALLGVAYLAWLHSGESKAGTRAQSFRGTLGLAAVAIAADLILGMSNTQRQGFPLSLIAILILTHGICRSCLSRQRRTLQRTATLPAAFALVAVILLMPVLSDTVNALGMVLRSNVLIGGNPWDAKVSAAHLARLVMGEHNEPGVDPGAHNGTAYVTRVNEGLALLRDSSSPTDRIACLWFANPFSYALLRPPVRGGSVVFAYGVDISAQHGPSAESILGNADVVIYPRKTIEEEPEIEPLLAIVRSSLTRDFTIAAESPQWVLWRRK